MDVASLNGGSVKADREFFEVLVALKLDTLRGVSKYAGPGYLRTHANRDNFHIVGHIGERSYDLFLKRHRGFEMKEALKLLMSRSPFMTAGRREWENIARLERLGIAAARPVAFGERRFWFLEVESFLITENIAGGTPMDDYLVRRFSGDLSKEMLREKRALLWDIGDLVRRLHQAGLTHMDLYLCHIFVRETSQGDKVLHLIDLQRLAKRWLFKKRWVIKDLAALLYSARHLPLSRTDLMRIFTAYFDGAISEKDRRLLAAALKRAGGMMKNV